MHFAGGYSDLRRKSAQCHDVWQQYQWQDAGKASREEVAYALNRAEEEIAYLLGYWPAWQWIVDERQHLEREGLWPNLNETRVITKWKHVIEGGIRAVTAIDAANVSRGADVDADGDGFAEWAVFSVSGVESSWDLEEIRACYKVYSAGDVANTRTDPSSESFDEAWEIRPLRMTRSGTTVTAYVHVWELFRPQLFEELQPDHINADVAANYVDTLSFYRVYNDVSTQVSFMWGQDCADNISCAWETQAGCIRAIDTRNGVVVIAPGTYSATSDSYTASNFTYRTVPNAARLWYKAGLDRPAPGVVDRRLARLIVQVACARLDYPICSCSNARLLVDDWRDNAAKNTKERTYSLTPAMLANPLGMRVGEVMTWQALNIPGTRLGKAVKT
jgi:hypothetical protein